MKIFYVIKNLRVNAYVSIYENNLYTSIDDAYEFDFEQDAIDYANEHFDYYFKFSIEKVYEIKKNK